MILNHIIGIGLIGILGIALCWEIGHLGWWADAFSGDVADTLREHAYEYASYVFGEEPFGWRLE